MVAHGGAADCVLESSYGKILSAYYNGAGASVGSLELPTVMWHYLSVAALDSAFDLSEAMGIIELGATTVSCYWIPLAEGA